MNDIDESRSVNIQNRIIKSDFSSILENTD